MTVRQRIRLGMALGAVAVVLWIAWIGGAAIAPFVVGGLLAYILAPLVQGLAQLTARGGRPQKRWARPAAILVIYGLAAAALSAIGLVAVPAIGRAFQDLFERREELLAGLQLELDRLLFLYRQRVPEDMQQQIDMWVEGFLTQAGDLALTAAQGILGFTVQSGAVLLGFLVIPIWLFLFVKDQPRFAAWFYGLFPVWMRPDVREVVTRAGAVVGSYIRAQVLLAVAVGLLSYAGLALLGVQYAIPLAVVAFFLEFIPIVGPILAGAVALLVVLATDPGWMLVWVLLLYVGIQQFESYILIPRIQGGALHVHPALIIMLVVILGQIFGVFGVLVAVPAYAALRNSFVYVYRRLGEGERLPEAAAAEEAAAPPAEEREPVGAERTQAAMEEREERKEEAA